MRCLPKHHSLFCHFRFCCLLWLALFGFISIGHSATRTVTKTTDTNDGVCDVDCSLREAISSSLAGDTINFAPALSGGIIALDNNLGELGIGRNLTINGPSGGVTLYGDSSYFHRILRIIAGTVSLSNCTINGGYEVGATGTAGTFSDYGGAGGNGLGGGILNSGTLTLSNCTIKNNATYGGSGGNGYSSTTTYSFGGNGGAGQGGGIYNEGTLTLVNSTVANNSTRGGYSGYTYAVSGNSARSSNGGSGVGGGIYNKSGAKLILRGCTLNDNFASGAGGTSGQNAAYGGFGGSGLGGGLYTSGTSTLANCTFSGNGSRGGSGAAGGSQSSSFNSDGSGGGAYGGAIGGSGLTLINCTISDNSAIAGAAGGSSASAGSANGGNLDVVGSTSIRNTIIANGTVSGDFTAGPDVDGSITSQGHNLIGKTDDSSGWIASDLTGTAAAPLNPQLLTLADNGGPTKTLALSATSVAINAGDDAVLSAPYNLTTDQRGFPRKISTHVDIGAYEYDLPQSSTSLQVTTTAEHNDGTCGISDCTLLEALNAANAEANANVITFKAGLSGTITNTTQPDGLTITNPVTIQGPGASVLAISGNSVLRVFYVNTVSSVAISGLTITKGNAATGSLSGDGGGIYNNGTLNLTNCAFKTNAAASVGGALCTFGTMALSGCTLSSNTAQSGGGIYSYTDLTGHTTTLLNCTLSGNSSTNKGGGLYNVNGKSVVQSCTITSNTAPAGGGSGVGSYGDSATQTTVNNSIIAGNTNSDVDYVYNSINSFQSSGYNLIGIGNATAAFTTANHDTINVISPKLGPLADNGGPTQTRALLIGSPALDAGNTTLTADQRGLPRPQGNADDIGAFELQPPSFSINDLSISEGNSGTKTLTFTVTRSGNTSASASVSYATQNGTATAPADYTATNGTLSFAAGQSTKTVNVLIKGDTLDEANETFKVNLSAPTNASIAKATGVGTITDDDASPSLTIADASITEGDSGTQNLNFTVTLSAASGQTVLVNAVTANGSATSPADYTATSKTLTFSPGGALTQTFSVPVKGDVLDEDSETFYVVLSSPANAVIGRGRASGTIADNDAPSAISVDDLTITEGNAGTKIAVFTLHLNKPSGKVIKVDVATANGTATAGPSAPNGDYVALPKTTVSFNAGSTATLAHVTINGDTRNEPNETFFLNLSNPQNVTIADTTAKCIITDDDAPPALTISDAAIIEGNSGTKLLTFTVNLSVRSNQDVVVHYATSDGIAKVSNNDYVAISSTIDFGASDTQALSKTISVTIKGDTSVEPDEAFYVLLSGAINASIGRARAVGTIRNDDASG